MAGSTLEDVYQIVNQHKTLEDVIGVSAIDPRDLSEEELSMSQRRQFKGNLVAIGCLLLLLILTIVIFLAISNAMFRDIYPGDNADTVL